MSGHEPPDARSAPDPGASGCGAIRQVSAAASLIALALCLTAPAAAAARLGGAPVSRRATDRAVGAPTAAPLTRVADVRRTDESTPGRHARLMGVVTYFDPALGLLFVQDETGGIFVFMRGVETVVHVGDLVRVDGRIDPADFAPSIKEPTVSVVGRASLPKPLQPGIDTLLTGVWDSQYVEIEGIVRGFHEPLREGHLTFDVAVGPVRVHVNMPGPWRGRVPRHLVDARVRLRGVCGTEFNRASQFVGVQLFLTRLEDITLVDEAPVDPFAAPVEPARALFRWSGVAASGHRVHVRGEVTWRSGRQLYLRDASGDIGVTLWSGAVDVNAGDRVDVTGFAEAGELSPVLRDASLKRGTAAAAAPAMPVAVTAGGLMRGTFDGALVTVDAQVVSVEEGGEPLIVLQAGDLPLTAVAPAGPDQARSWLPPAGSRVRLTGVCRVQTDPLDNPRVLRAVQLLLRAPGDVVTVTPAPWWSKRRVLELVSGLGLAALGAIAWVIALRRRVTRQTQVIGDRLESELALRAQYQELFASANDIVLTCDAGGRLTAINAAGERATGYTAPSALGMQLADIVAPESRAVFEEQLAACLSRPGGCTVEADLARPDGQRVSIEFAARPLPGHGAASGVQAIGRDVTERNRTAEALARAKTAAEAANRAKSQFVANISHEVRTPLNGIIGMTDLMMASRLDDEQRQYLGLMRTSADALLHVISDVLDLSKIEAGHFDLSPAPFALLDRLETLLEPQAVMARRKGLQFTLTVAPELPRVLVGDAERLSQILINLVGNAVKFTGEGRIEIAVSPGAPAPSDTVSQCRVRFAVRDTGIGIPADKHAAIFGAFTQADGSTSRRFGGTGLGLAIAASLAHRMGGAIDVVSAPGQGATFTLTLPFVRGQRGEVREDGTGGLARLLGPAAAPAWSSKRPARRLSVLLVEDNPVNQRLALEILTRRGHEVAVADNGGEALERLGTFTPQIILMDVQMPEVNGLEATRAIRLLEQGTGRHVPIVAMTAHAMSGDRERCLEAGMDDYLTKPIRAEALVAHVERLAMNGPEDTTSPAAAVPDHAVFDLDEALGRVDGDRELLAEIAGLFLADATPMLDAVRTALAAGDPERMGRAAHRLKGSVLTFGAARASGAAQAIEELGRSGRLDGAADLVRTLETEVRRLVTALAPLAGAPQ